MENKKLISFNVDVMKERVQEAKEAIGSKAKERKDKALSSILDKGIELSKRQLSALQSVRKNLG